MLKVYNLDKDFRDYAYVVAREIDGELWFWGSWENELKARKVALELGNGVVVATEMIE